MLNPNPSTKPIKKTEKMTLTRGIGSHFQWTTKVSNNEEDEAAAPITNAARREARRLAAENQAERASEKNEGKKLQARGVVSVVVRAFGRMSRLKHDGDPRPLHRRVVLGTLFGNKQRGHVYFAFQNDAKSYPALLLHLSTPITGLVREMGSGTVRIALESDRRKSSVPLLKEGAWRASCNGTDCGVATRAERMGPDELRALRSVGPISMGAGVLESPQEMVYLRARFQRVVGSPHSQAFYMLNPDEASAAPPELSIYFLRL